MASYLFSLGNSDDGPIGFCARVSGASEEDALTTLKEHLEAINRTVSAHKYADTDENIEYVEVYFNPNAISLNDLEEGETEEDDDEDDDACEYCDRAGGAAHTGDCEQALADDLEEGSIGPDSDRYSDAVAAYSTVYGKDFVPTDDDEESE